MPIDQENNERAQDRLIELLKTGRALAFVGAGSSTWVDYPDWDKLLELMEAKIRDKDRSFNGSILKESGDTLWHAYKLKEILDEDFYPFIKETFGPKNNPCHDFHIHLMSLPFQHIITSNYDPVLEHAFFRLQRSKPFERFRWDEKKIYVSLSSGWMNQAIGIRSEYFTFMVGTIIRSQLFSLKGTIRIVTRKAV